MRTHFFAASVLAAFVLSPWAATSTVAQDHTQHAAPAAKAMACCDSHTAAAQKPMACCDNHEAMAQKAMACCDDHKAPATAAMACCGGNDAGIAMAALGFQEKPDVQTLAVTFRDPVKVGDVILMGNYVIEHDNARMARGEPCTYIYEAADQRLPVVVFHCTHLERPEPTSATVVLRPGNDYPIKELQEFQFLGETASHGVPSIR
jgi:hypothetical protein